jgi:hypothetical protein
MLDFGSLRGANIAIQSTAYPQGFPDTRQA